MMSAPVVCQQFDDRFDRDITIKAPTDHEYSKSTSHLLRLHSTFCGQSDLVKTLPLTKVTGASKTNHSSAQQLGPVQVSKNDPYKECEQLTSVRDCQVHLVDNGNKRCVGQIVSRASGESFQGGIVNPSVVQASHDVLVRTASSTLGLTHELIQKESQASQELAGQQHFVGLPSMTVPQTGNMASDNTNQLIPMKFAPAVAQGLMRDQGKEVMVKSSEKVPADNASTKPASISPTSVGIPTAIGHLLQDHTNDISMNQREVSGDNQVVVCAARADINTNSAGQSVVQKPLRDFPKEVQPSPPRIHRITDPCSVTSTDTSKDSVSFPKPLEEGKCKKRSQSDTSEIQTPSAAEKFILLKLTPQADKGPGDGTCSSIKYLAVPTKKSDLNAEQVKLLKIKGTDCSETVSILNGNPSLITPSSDDRGTRWSSSLVLNEVAERTESTKRCFVTQHTTNNAMSKNASSNDITYSAEVIEPNIQSTANSTNTDKSGNSSCPGGLERGCHIKYIGITADEVEQSSDPSRRKNVTPENDSAPNQKSDCALAKNTHGVPNILKQRNVSTNVHFSLEKSDLAKVNGKFVENLNRNKQTVPETVTVEPEQKRMGRQQKTQSCESKSQTGSMEISNLDEPSYPDTVSSDEEVAGTEEILNQEIPTVQFHLEREASTTGPGRRWTAVRESNDKSEVPKRSDTVLTSTESLITGPPEAPEISAEENETSPGHRVDTDTLSRCYGYKSISEVPPAGEIISENRSSDGIITDYLSDGKSKFESSKPMTMDKFPQGKSIESTSSKAESTGDTSKPDNCSENVLKEPSSEHMTETESGDLVQPTIPTVRFQLTTQPGPETPRLTWTKVTLDTISSNPRSGPAEDKVLPDQPATATTGVTDTACKPTRFCDPQTENGTVGDAKNPNADKTLYCETIYKDGDGSVDKLSLPDYLHDKNKLSVEMLEDVNESDTQLVEHASSTRSVQEVGNSLATFAGIPPSQSKAAPIIYQTSSAKLIKLTGSLSYSTDGGVMVSNSGHISEGTHPPPESSALFHTRNPGAQTRLEDNKVIPPIFAPCSLPVQGKTVAIKIVSSGDTSTKSTPSTKVPIEKLSQDCISQQNLSTQTVIYINQPSKSWRKQNSRKSDGLATAETHSSHAESKPCLDIEGVKSALPSDKAHPQPQKSNISKPGKSMAETLKGKVRIPLHLNPIIDAIVSDQHQAKECAQSTATVVDVRSKELPKQGTTTKIIPLHNIFRSTTGPNQNLPVKQKVNNPPEEIKKCPVVLKSEPALQLNQFLEKQSCYIPNVQSGSSIGELVVQDHRFREIRRKQTGLYPNKRKLKPTLKSSIGETTESISSQTEAGMSSLLWKDSDPVLNEVETLKAQKNVDAIEVTPDGQKLILKKDLFCMICREQFAKPEGLAAHVMVSHFKFKCQVCLTIFTKQDLYVQHVKGPRCLQEDARLYRPSFRCGDCWKCYRTRAALDKHQLRQHGAANRCSICEKTFPTFGPLCHHLIKDHVDKTWVCDLCGKFFQLKNYMLKHRKRHSMEKTFLCPTCGKCLKDASTLRDHVDIHKPEGERQYRFMCSYCGKRFNCRLIFQDHVNTHTGKTPYACKSCAKTFSRLAYLKKHELVHSDKKPFECDVCWRAFKLKPALKAHMVTHTGVSKYKCTYCQRSFGNTCILKAHVERCKKKHLTQVKEAQECGVTQEASIIVKTT